LQIENSEAYGPQGSASDVHIRYPSSSEELPHVQGHPSSEPMDNNPEFGIKEVHVQMTK
jgi:hypothetical protein